PRRFGATISNRSASGFWAPQVSSALTTEPCTSKRRDWVAMRDSGVTKYRVVDPLTLLFSPRMQGTTSSQFNAAGAGGVLLTVLVACIGVGVLLGWAAGSGAIGALLGAVVGIIGGIVAVYLRYRDAI